MHGNNPTRDYIEQALAAAAEQGLIVSWERERAVYGPAPKWRVVFRVGCGLPIGDGVTPVPVRTYAEGKLLAAALESASSRVTDLETC